MKNYKLLLFLFLVFFACNKDKNSVFETSLDELRFECKPVPGGAMVKYTLPNDRNIFAMNVYYTDTNNNPVLKSAGYSGDSILLDGFTRAQSASAKVTLVDNYGNESKSVDLTFSTENSAPWSFFDGLKVTTAWNGFTISYAPTSVATGMAHVFYLGKNPLTQQEDTILVEKGSFPIRAKGDTITLIPKQKSGKNTIIIRTEDFSGYRVRQEIHRDVETYISEKHVLTEKDFKPGGTSIEHEKAQTGVKYLFDGDVIGQIRIDNPGIRGIGASGIDKFADIFGSYLAIDAIGRPMIIDLGKPKALAFVRLYSLVKLDNSSYTIPEPGFGLLGEYWQGQYLDKCPCDVDVYGHVSSDNPGADGWVRLTGMSQEPLTESPWNLPPSGTKPNDTTPLFYDMTCKPNTDAYRYLKIVVNKTFRIPGTSSNIANCVHIQELEVHVKVD